MKWLSRRDGDTAPLRNDLYVAQSFLAGSLSTLALYLFRGIVNRHPSAVDCFGMLMFYVVVFVGLAVIDRYYGWTKTNSNHQRHWAYGILLPNVVGALCYIGVFVFAKMENL